MGVRAKQVVSIGILGAVAVWATPAFGVDMTPGRFTGGGRFYSEAGVKMTHGFELHCDVDDVPNRLQVNWDGNRWHMESMTWAACSDRDGIDPAPPVAPSDVHNGRGVGRLNGVSGATAEWRIIDKGEPGTRDRIAITIWDAGGNVVISTVGGDGSFLDQGNHQAHKQN